MGVDEKSPVSIQMTLLHSAVECEILSPKSKWKLVINSVDNYIEELEKKVEEMEKMQSMKVLDCFKDGEKK